MDEFLAILKKELASLKKSTLLIQNSYEKCLKIGIKANSNYSYTELDAFEALTARFSRLSDLLIQKIFRLIDTLELVNEGTMVDRINRAEKREIVSSAKKFIELRLLRNTIVHEYEPDEYTRIFQDVLNFTPTLLNAVEKAEKYCQKFKS